MPLETSIEFYKIVCQNFENDIDRRMRMNQFYFTVSASICVAASFVIINKKSIIEVGFSEITFLTFIGSLLTVILFINISWLAYIKVHGKLQLAQIQIIKAIEESLSHKGVGAVIDLFHQKPRRFTRTSAERLIPISFLIFGTALLAQVLISKL